MPSGKKISINYTSRDFDTIKSDLVNYAKKYYSDTYQDFSETGFGSLMLDTVSYVGDILSFYVDYQANEGYLASAIEYDNVVRHARQLGYRLNKSPSSYGTVAFYIVVPAVVDGPNRAYMPVLKQGSVLSSDNNTRFTLTEDVDFANTKNNVVVATVNSTTGLPTSYANPSLRGKWFPEESSKRQFSVGDYERFRKVELGGTDIAEIVSIEDAEGE